MHDRWRFYPLLVLLQYHLAVGDILTAIQFITTFSLMCSTFRSPCIWVFIQPLKHPNRASWEDFSSWSDYASVIFLILGRCETEPFCTWAVDVPLYQPHVRAVKWSIWWNVNWQRKPKYMDKSFPSATQATTNPIYNERGLNSSHLGGKPKLDHGLFRCVNNKQAWNTMYIFWAIWQIMLKFELVLRCREGV
jgi:hypothetical protein